jgi:hypothetical protein
LILRRLLFASTIGLALGLGLGLEREARAQGNYRATPIGGRSALMGGTGIALARDGSAPFLNPATIADIGDTSVAFSVNFYSFSNTRFTDFHQPGAVDHGAFGNLELPGASLQQSRFDSLPSTLCLFLTVRGWTEEEREIAAERGEAPTKGRKGRQKLAACLGNLERQQLDADAVAYRGDSNGFSANQAQSLHRTWNRFYAGPTFSAYLTDQLALGLSLHGVDTTYSSSWSSSSLTLGPGGRSIGSSLDTTASASSFDLGAILGAQYHLDRHYTLGLSIQSPSFHVAGSYDQTFHTQYDGLGRYDALVTANGDFTAPPPIRVGAGLGAKLGRVVLEVDATYFFQRAEATRADLQVTETSAFGAGAASQRQYGVIQTERANPVLDSAFGFEWFASRAISLLGGVSTDFSAVPILSTAPTMGSVALSRTHRVGGSFGIGSYGDGSQLLFGTEVSYGWGKAFVVNDYVLPSQWAIVDESQVSVLIVIAGSTSLSTLKRTVTNLGHIVKPE